MNKERSLQSGIFLIETIIISLGITLFFIEELKLEEYIVIKLMYFIIGTCLIGISYIAYKEEKLHWILEEEYIESISEENRKKIVGKYLKRFKKCCVGLLIYSFIGIFLKTNLFLDIVIYMILIIVLEK